jgi:hypothetical protein
MACRVRIVESSYCIVEREGGVAWSACVDARNTKILRSTNARGGKVARGNKGM